MLYTGSSFSPNSALKFDWPKKYQPMIVENAKKNMHTAMKIGPKPPNAWLKAAWVSDVPVMPLRDQAGRDQHQAGQRQHNEGVNEHAQDRHSALVLRALDLGQRVGVGRRTKARLVGEQAAGHAETHGLLHSHACNAARHGLRLKRQHKHLRQRAGQRLGVDDQNGDAPRM